MSSSSLPTELIPEDYDNLKLALSMAQKSMSTGGVPIGAVLSVSPCPLWLTFEQGLTLLTLLVGQSAVFGNLFVSIFWRSRGLARYHHPTKTVLSTGHNQRVQMGSNMRHGEGDCLENLGRTSMKVMRECVSSISLLMDLTRLRSATRREVVVRDGVDRSEEFR